MVNLRTAKRGFFALGIVLLLCVALIGTATATANVYHNYGGNIVSTTEEESGVTDISGWIKPKSGYQVSNIVIKGWYNSMPNPGDPSDGTWTVKAPWLFDFSTAGMTKYDVVINYQSTNTGGGSDQNCMVQFISDGVEVDRYAPIQKGTVIVAPEISKSGSVIEGWYKSENFSSDSKWDFDDKVWFNLKLYANWTTGTSNTGGNETTGSNGTGNATGGNGTGNATVNETGEANVNEKGAVPSWVWIVAIIFLILIAVAVYLYRKNHEKNKD